MGCHCKNAHTFQMNSALAYLKILYFCKRYNFIKLIFNFYLSHAQDGTVKIDIFSASQLWVKACPYFQLATRPLIEMRPTVGSVMRLKIFKGLIFLLRCDR